MSTSVLTALRSTPLRVRFALPRPTPQKRLFVKPIATKHLEGLWPPIADYGLSTPPMVGYYQIFSWCEPAKKNCELCEPTQKLCEPVRTGVKIYANRCEPWFALAESLIDTQV